jgi:hypothetical protein
VILYSGLSLITGFAIWALLPSAPDVRIAPEPVALCRYDDGAGHSPLLAVMRVTNVSKKTVWFLGPPEEPLSILQKREAGNWDSHMSGGPNEVRASTARWTAMRSMESITVTAAPITEEATEMRIGLAFTTEKFTPTKVHWIFSPIAKIVKRRNDFFAEPIEGASQEVQVLPLAP